MKKLNVPSTITIDSLLSGLDNLDLREAIMSDTWTQQVFDIAKDTSLYRKFGALTREELLNILKTSDFHAHATSPTKWTNHFYGRISDANVRLITFLIAQQQEATKEHVSNFYTNYKVLNEVLTVTKTDLSGNYLVASDDSGNILAYVKSPKNPSLFMGRRPSGKYNSFTTKNSPASAEGHLVKTYATNQAKNILDYSLNKVASFSNDSEKSILNEIRTEAIQYPVLLDSICFGLVDSMNVVTSISQMGVAKKAGNALLGHNYLTHNAFDENALFSLGEDLRNDIHTELTKIVKGEQPYLNQWLPVLTAFVEADKRARTQSSLFSGMLNMFFSTFGNLFSVLSKAVGLTTAAPFALQKFLGRSTEEKIAQTFDLVANQELYYFTTADKTLLNSFVRVKWDVSTSSSYRLSLELASIITDGSTISKRVASDVKVARLPYEAVDFLLKDSLNQDPGRVYNREAFLARIKEASSGAISTINAGNEQKLYDLLSNKLIYSGENSPIFSLDPEILYAGMPQVFMELASLSFSDHKIIVLPVDPSTLDLDFTDANLFTAPEFVNNKSGVKMPPLDTNKIKLSSKDAQNKTSIQHLDFGGNPDDLVEQSQRYLTYSFFELFTKLFKENVLSSADPGDNFENVILQVIHDCLDILCSKEPTSPYADYSIYLNSFSEFNGKRIALRDLLFTEIKKFFVSKFVSATPLVEALLKDLYNPSTPLETVLTTSNPTYMTLLQMLKNIRVGFWGFSGDDAYERYIGDKSILAPRTKAQSLQLNRDSILTILDDIEELIQQREAKAENPAAAQPATPAPVPTEAADKKKTAFQTEQPAPIGPLTMTEAEELIASLSDSLLQTLIANIDTKIIIKAIFNFKNEAAKKKILDLLDPAAVTKFKSKVSEKVSAEALSQLVSYIETLDPIQVYGINKVFPSKVTDATKLFVMEKLDLLNLSILLFTPLLTDESKKQLKSILPDGKMAELSNFRKTKKVKKVYSSDITTLWTSIKALCEELQAKNIDIYNETPESEEEEKIPGEEADTSSGISNFLDLSRIPAEGIIEILKTVNITILTTALAGTPQKFQKLFLTHMDPKEASTVKKNIQKAKTLDLRVIEIARTQVLALVNDLISSGTILITEQPKNTEIKEHVVYNTPALSIKNSISSFLTLMSHRKGML